MDIRVSRKGFYKIITSIFDEIGEFKKGHPVLIPIESNHQIYINEIMIFLDKNKKHFFSINAYGQLAIERQEDGYRSNHITFDLKDLESIEFLAQSITEEINEKTGKPYNEMYRFELDG